MGIRCNGGIDMFEATANRQVQLGDRLSFKFDDLMPPVNQIWKVYGWEQRGLIATIPR